MGGHVGPQKDLSPSAGRETLQPSHRLLGPVSDPSAGDVDVRRFPLDPEKCPVLEDRGDPRSAAPGERVEQNPSGWCGQPDLWMQLRRGLTIADVAGMVPERDLVPVRMPTGMIYLVDRLSYVRCQSFGFSSPPVKPPARRRRARRTECDWEGYATERERCLTLSLGRKGCGCITCRRELAQRAAVELPPEW